MQVYIFTLLALQFETQKCALIKDPKVNKCQIFPPNSMMVETQRKMRDCFYGMVEIVQTTGLL